MLLGFTDSNGKAALNRTVAYHRAACIEKELQSRGIYPQIVEGIGEDLPVASNRTAAGREKNRRVEAWIF